MDEAQKIMNAQQLVRDFGGRSLRTNEGDYLIPLFVTEDLAAAKRKHTWISGDGRDDIADYEMRDAIAGYSYVRNNFIIWPLKA